MLKIGRYGLAFGRVFWFQTRVPTRVRHFLRWFWFLKEVNPNDVNLEQVDEQRQFLAGSEVEREGRLYRYWRAKKDIGKGKVVQHSEVEH